MSFVGPQGPCGGAARLANRWSAEFGGAVGYDDSVAGLAGGVEGFGEGTDLVHLGRDIADRIWDTKYGYLRDQPQFEGSLVLIVSPGERPA